MSCLRALILFACAFTGLAVLAPCAQAQPTWTAQQSGTTQDLWTVSNGGYYSADGTQITTYFIAAGTGGTILTSTDAVTWTPQKSPTTVWLVASVPGIIVGDQGTILTSSDGVTWIQRAGSPGASRLNGIAIGNSLILAVGENGTVARSADNGVTWTFGSSGASGWLRGIIYNARTQLFTICGQGGALLSTPDGVSFTTLQSGTTSDLEAMSIRFPTNSAEVILGGASGYLASSLDGVTWTPFLAPSGAHFRGTVMFNDTGVAVGSGGDTAFGFFNPNAPSNSTNPTTGFLPDLWEEVSTGSSADLYGVTWGFAPGSTTTETAVAVGQAGAIYTSLSYHGIPAASLGILGPLATAYGQTITLSAAAVGQPPLSYQWTFNGQVIPGATQSSLTWPSIGPAQNGQYALTISNILGSSQTYAYTLAATYEAAIPGLVDESFAGQTVSPTLTPPAVPAAVVVQPDGKILIGGTNSVSRLNSDGSLDTAFQPAAAAALAAASHETLLGLPGFNQLQVQSDGKILIAGTWRTFPLGGQASFSWRLNSDGSIDPSYTPVEQISDGGAFTNELLIPGIQLASGQYLSTTSTANTGESVVRLNNNGTQDSTFQTFIPPGAPSGSATFAKDAASGIVLVISTSSINETYICRLNSDGSYNPNFTPQTLKGSLAAGPFLLSGQNIVVLTNETGSSNGSGATNTYHLRGVGFSYAGLDIPSSPSLPWTIPAGVAGPDGSLYLYLTASLTSSKQPGSSPNPAAALSTFQGTYRNGIIRIDPNGNFDPTYTLNIPLVVNSPSPGLTGLTGLAPTPTNQWIAWGNFVLLNAETHEAIVRLNPQVGTNFASLVNLSARAQAGQGTQALDLGITTSGPANLPVLLRGIGPALASFGVTGVLADPELTLYSSTGATLATDNNWSDNGQGLAIAATAQAVGAFALPPASLDAAALANLSPGVHSFVVQGANNGTGNALAEVYATSPGTIAYGAPRPINLSFRAPVGTGASLLTAGFVLGGGNTKHVLLRAIGPTLATFGITDAVPDPVLSLYSGSTLIATNQNWSANATPAAQLAATFTDVGAFALPAGSADAALALDLSPGAYTVEATSASNTAGIALVEVYEVP